MKHRVMIVDDQYVSRQMFELYLKDSAKYEVAYTLDSALFADTYVLKGDIDLVIMDILMEDESCGLDAAAKIKKLSPKVKIIAVTSMPEVSWLDKAKKIGIESFWYEESDISIHTVKTHIKHLLLKTGYKSRTKLAIQARITGMVIEDK